MTSAKSLNETNLVARDLARSIPVISGNRIPREKLNGSDFYRRYASVNLPVILSDVISHWPALEKWTPDFFSQTYGDKKLTLRDENREVLLADFVDQVKNANSDSPAPYLRNVHIRTDFPELLADVDENFAFCKPDYLNSRLLPRNWIRPDRQVELFFGGVGTQIFTLHYDIYFLHNFIIGIYGEKEFVLVAPEDTQFLYPDMKNNKHSPINVFEPDFNLYPEFRKATPLYGTLGPGDAVFVPAGWWHMTRIKTPSISVGMCNLEASNWSYFMDDVRPPPEDGKTLRWHAVRSYLHAAGLGLKAMQWGKSFI